MFFASDNSAGISDKILAAIAAANSGPASSYGGDALTEALTARMAEVFERPVSIFPVATGTAANILSLAAIAPPWSGILCSHSAHVMTDECGGAEMFTGGAKMFGVDGRHSKIDPAVLADRLAGWPDVVPHHVRPAAISISQVSEFGSAWSAGEVGAIGDLARQYGLKLHMDGARFANAVAALGCAPADITWRAGVDILSFGATKNGALTAETIVVFDPELAVSLPFRRMKSGHLLSKSRFLAAQMLAYLDDGHWLDLAGHANAMAAKVADAVGAAPKARLAVPVDANEVFAYLQPEADAALKDAGAVYHRWPGGIPDEQDPPVGPEVLVRFVTSFQTTGQDVGRFAQVLADA